MTKLFYIYEKIYEKYPSHNFNYFGSWTSTTGCLVLDIY